MNISGPNTELVKTGQVNCFQKKTAELKKAKIIRIEHKPGNKTGFICQITVRPLLVQ